MSNTPETDAKQKLKDMIGDEYVSADFARKLERERDEARNAFIMAVDEMVQVQSKLREAKIEWDEARDTVATMEIRHAAAMFHAQRVVDDANQLREQRDKLAAVLRKIRDGYGGQLAGPNCCEDCDFLLPIDEALQPLTQNK